MSLLPSDHLAPAAAGPGPACTRCGAPLLPGARFCTACGHAAAHPAEVRHEGVPAEVRRRGGRMLAAGAALAALTVLTYGVWEVSAVCSVLAMVLLLYGWGVRQGAVWALEALPARHRGLPHVQAYFWGDERCPGCGATPREDARFCTSCGHAVHPDTLSRGGGVFAAFRRLKGPQPVEASRTQAFLRREPQETTDRYFLLAVVTMLAAWVLFTAFEFVSLWVVTGAVFVAPVFFLLWIRTQDRFEPEPWSLTLLAFAWGAFSAVFALPINVLVQAPQIAGISEEVPKALFLLFLASHRVLRKEFNGPVDGLIYGGAAGLGFAALENFFYVLEITELTGDFFLGLTLRSALVFDHMAWTGITGSYLGLMMLRNGRVTPKDLLVGVLPAALLHALNNSLDLLFGGLGLFLLPLTIALTAWFFFKLYAEGLRDEGVWARARPAAFGAEETAPLPAASAPDAGAGSAPRDTGAGPGAGGGGGGGGEGADWWR